MQKVLCRFRCETSEPNLPGWATPTMAFVGAVQVDLAAGLVHQFADLGHGFLEHAMRGRVGDHQRGQLVADLFDLGAQVGQVDVAVGVGGHHHHIHAGQLGRAGLVPCADEGIRQTLR